jgi:DNA topoisomerase IB
VSAKDFRTWNATVIAAKALAVSGLKHGTQTGRKRAIVYAVKEVAYYLGNTPAVARASYIDPRVFDRFNDGLTLDLEAMTEPVRARGGGARPHRRRRGSELVSEAEELDELVPA